jgi:hypothetical protein
MHWDAREGFMDFESIQKQVDESVQTWSRVARYSPGPAEVTPGARESLAIIINKIQTDPSPAWGKFEPDDVQRFALSSIPGILNDVSRRETASKKPRVVSTWELLHAMSGILDHFCPIPKGK